jgi:hypothetical protein
LYHRRQTSTLDDLSTKLSATLEELESVKSTLAGLENERQEIVVQCAEMNEVGLGGTLARGKAQNC